VFAGRLAEHYGNRTTPNTLRLEDTVFGGVWKQKAQALIPSISMYREKGDRQIFTRFYVEDDAHRDHGRIGHVTSYRKVSIG
jgi:hypothetical protein